MKNKKLKLLAIFLSAIIIMSLFTLALPASAMSAEQSDEYSEDEYDVSDNSDKYDMETVIDIFQIICDIILWAYIIIGDILVPAILFVIGIVLAFNKKKKFGKHWLILSGASLVWIMSTLGIIVSCIVTWIVGG